MLEKSWKLTESFLKVMETPWNTIYFFSSYALKLLEFAVCVKDVKYVFFIYFNLKICIYF